MKMNLSQQDLLQGRTNQNRTKETPNSFALDNSATNINPGNDLDKQSGRAAGPMGQRAMAMMQDPAEIQRTMNWMNAFKLSPAAMENGWVMPPPAPAPADPAA